MKLLKILTIIISTFFLNNIEAQKLELNSNTSTLNWTGKAAFSSYSLTGTIKPKQGILIIDNNKITELSITINTNSINHNNNDLKRHLLSKDFFDAKKFKKAYFKLIKPAIIIDNVAILYGKMTIKNITKEETITVNLKNNNTIISFDIILDRTKYGIKFNSPSFFKKIKENAISDEFALKGSLQFE